MTTIWIETITAAGILAAGLLLAFLAGRLLNGTARRLSQQTRTTLDNIFLAALQFPARAAIIVLAINLALRQFGDVPAGWWNVLDPAFFVVYWGIAFLFLYRLVDGLFRWYGNEIAQHTESEIDDRFLTLFRRLALLTLIVVVVITLLGRFGIEVSALVASLGIGSLAVALAAQDTLGNLFAGLSIMIDQPFKVGDRVELLEIDTWGDVVEIGLRSTRIRTRDNRMVTVPNAVIGKGLIVNYSVPSSRYRVETHVGIAYGTDIDVARRIMIEAIRAEPWVMPNERIEALFLEFGDSALIFRVRCWIEHYVETRRVIDKMNTALYKALNEAGISIPFPRRDLHLVSSRVSLAPPDSTGLE